MLIMEKQFNKKMGDGLSVKLQKDSVESIVNRQDDISKMRQNLSNLAIWKRLSKEQKVGLEKIYQETLDEVEKMYVAKKQVNTLESSRKFDKISEMYIKNQAQKMKGIAGNEVDKYHDEQEKFWKKHGGSF